MGEPEVMGYALTCPSHRRSPKPQIITMSKVVTDMNSMLRAERSRGTAAEIGEAGALAGSVLW